MPSIFITGAGGCVGHYLVDEFSPDYQLYLLVRNPGKLRFAPEKKKNIVVVKGDLDNLSAAASLLSEMDYCIHAATSWGGKEAERINVQRSRELFNLLNPKRIRRVIYFSTASILGRDMEVLPEAEQYGTEYIRTKSRCFRELPGCALYDRITTVFPTLVFGGDGEHPFSHLSRGLPLLKRYAWLIGRLNVKACFHFIHARDIAAVVRCILEAPQVEKKYVLGNDPVTVGQFTKRAAEYFGYRIGRQLTISPMKIFRFIKFFGAEVSAWDRFCIEYRDFSYPVVNCQSFGLPSDLSTVEEILADWEQSFISGEEAEKKAGTRRSFHPGP